MQPLCDDSVYQLINYDGRWSVRFYGSRPPVPGVYTLGSLDREPTAYLVATVRCSSVEAERAYAHARTQFKARLSTLCAAVAHDTAFLEVEQEVRQVLTDEHRYMQFEVQHLYTAFATMSTVDEGRISIPKNIDGIVNPAHRLRLSFAKWFARILTHYKAHADVEELQLLNKLTPQLLNKLSVLWSRTALTNKIDLIEGGDLLDAYYSGMPSSCMAHADHPGVLFYAKNPVEMAVVRDNDGKITGRALVWTTTTGEKFMDRAYPDNAGLEWYALQQWAKSNVQYYRIRNGSVARTVGDESCNIVVKMRKYPVLPYLDTLAAYLDDPSTDGYILLTNGTSIDCETTSPVPTTTRGLWAEDPGCGCDKPWLSCYAYALDGKPLAIEELRELSPDALARVHISLACRGDESDDEDTVYCRDTGDYRLADDVQWCAQCGDHFSQLRSMATVQLGADREAEWCYSCRSVEAVELDGQWWVHVLVDYCINCNAWIVTDKLADLRSTTPVSEYRCADCLTYEESNNDTTETPSTVQAEPAEPESTPPDPVQCTLVSGARALREPIDGSRLDEAIDSSPAYPPGRLCEGQAVSWALRQSFRWACPQGLSTPTAPLGVGVRDGDDLEPSGVLRSS